jgi:hypothetical protein
MLKLINPYVLIGVLVALAGAFFYGMAVGTDRAEASQARLEALVAEVRETAQAAAAKEIAKIKVVNQTHKQVIEREIVNVPVYSECRNTPDGVRAINSALKNRPLPAGSGELP